MSRGKSWKRGWAAALAAGLVLLGGCAGAPAESAPPEAEPYRVQNDGREARLVLGFIADGSPRAEVLAEIGEKYTAEYPHTQIAVESFDSFAELDSAARQGRVDILEVPGGRQAELVEDGVLLDFSEALFGWEEYAALTPAAKMTAGSMGKGKAYLLMEDFRQLRLYYRAASPPTARPFPAPAKSWGAGASWPLPGKKNSCGCLISSSGAPWAGISWRTLHLGMQRGRAPSSSWKTLRPARSNLPR